MKISKTLAICAFAFSVALVGTSAQAAKVKWKMHSAWGSHTWVGKPYDLPKISANSPTVNSPLSSLSQAL